MTSNRGPVVYKKYGLRAEADSMGSLRGFLSLVRGDVNGSPSRDSTRSALHVLPTVLPLEDVAEHRCNNPGLVISQVLRATPAIRFLAAGGTVA